MNKLIYRLMLVLAAVSLTGCGLKGPLYFPPAEKPKQQTAPVTPPDNVKQVPTTDPSPTR